MNFWNDDIEKQFFIEALKNFATPEQLFYKVNSNYLAYIPNSANVHNQTLQSRNSLIGKFTEKWTRDFFEPIAKKLGLYAVNGVVCDTLSLTNKSSADLAFCTNNSTYQTPENIKLICEIKMSVVSNYQYDANIKILKKIGDYKTHKGQPSLLRSDSMLKAIGKSINIRVSSIEAAKIPIIIIGNSPITESYTHKVDFLKSAGVVQGFISLNSNPTNSEYIKSSSKDGFKTFDNYNELQNSIETLLSQDLNYFSSMLSKNKLGEIIRIAGHEITDIQKAEKFLELMRNV